MDLLLAFTKSVTISEARAVSLTWVESHTIYLNGPHMTMARSLSDTGFGQPLALGELCL